MMSLFPAFTSDTNDDYSNKNTNTDLEWLSNPSFKSVDVLSLQQRIINPDPPDTHTRVQNSDDDDDDDDVRLKKRKKKEKKKKEKKKKKHRRVSESSDSDTVYPRDLLKQQQHTLPRSEDQRNVGGVLWVDDLPEQNERFFYLDRKPDPSNWEFRSLYRAHISRYRRKGSSALGLDGRTQAVTWGDSALKKKRGEKKEERYFSLTNHRALRSEAPPTLILPAPPSHHTLEAFIPLPPCAENSGSAPPSGHASSDPLGVYDPATLLWSEGRGQPEVKEEQQPRPPGRVEEFNRRLRENPADVQLWISFIHSQDELGSSLSGRHQEGAEPVGGSERALCERKLSIVERALEANPSSVELKLERLRLGRELWDSAALLREWRQLVFIHPNSAPLWRRYIHYTQSHFSSFSVSTVNAVYRKCLSTLSAVQDGQMTSHPPLPGTERGMLDVFVSQCHFLRQVGCSEKAVSLFLALLEFTFLKPPSVRELTTKQQVEFFEPFWDSGEARVGESGARGWSAWMRQQERGGWIHTPEPDEDEEEEEETEIKDKTRPKWRIWLDMESWREANHWLPWRPDKSKGQSEEDCEDPDRQVLFDDLGPSLIQLETPELRLCLLLSFLHFLGVPVSSAPLSCGLALDDSALLDDPTLVDEPLDTERPLTSFSLPVTGVSVVGHMTWLRDTRRRWAGLCKQGEELLRNVLDQILPLFPPEDRTPPTLCWVQYQKLRVLHCIRSGNKKRAGLRGRSSKRLLKRVLKQQENRGSLALWREYAHLEWILGNVEEARRVFDSALTLGVAAGLGDPALCELCLLYAQLEVEVALTDRVAFSEATPTSSRAVHVLTKLAEGAPYRPFTGAAGAVSILKARKVYECAVSGGGAGHNRSALIGCFGLFQYLTVGVDAADSVFTRARGPMEGGGGCEALCLQHVALLRHHATQRLLPLKRLKSALSHALTLLPHSATLWRLHLQVHTHNHSAAHTRRFLSTVVKGNRSVIPRLFAVATELQRKERIDAVLRSGLSAQALPIFPETGLSNRIRSLFEAAVGTESGARCPLLWRMYITYTVCNGDVERGRGIFYKALQNVPWVKALYMDAVQLFPDQVQEFLDLLMEKELRLRTPMEEIEILLED